jgi:hypothetical protein
MGKSIFISIAAYRDDELWPTVLDAIESARDPGALHVAILEQSPQQTPPPNAATPQLQRLGKLSHLHLHHRFSRGPCWARALLATLIEEEAYFLQIDSHMRFDMGWDETLIQTLEGLSAHGTRNIISTYPCRFDYGAAPHKEAAAGSHGSSSKEAIRKLPNPGQALVLRPKPEERLRADHPVLTFHAELQATSQPVAGHHVGAGCLFTRTALVREVPIDPHLYFHGEEQNIAVRAWTSGWNIWHTPDMPIYHLYHDPAASSRPLHWDAQEDAQRSQPWTELERRSKQRMATLLYGTGDSALLGSFCLGRERTLEEFARASGIDYATRQIDRRSAAGAIARPPGLDFKRLSWYSGSVLKSVVLKN